MEMELFWGSLLPKLHALFLAIMIMLRRSEVWDMIDKTKKHLKTFDLLLRFPF